MPLSLITLFLTGKGTDAFVRHNLLVHNSLRLSALQVKSSNNTHTISPYGRQNIKFRPHELANQRNGDPSSCATEKGRSIATMDPLMLKRDRALLALYSSLNMNIEDAATLLDDFPQLYQDCPSLKTRIYYFRQELNISKKKILSLLQKHPGMMIQVLLNDPETNLACTVELLQTELNLTLEEIMRKRLWQMNRMELRPKLGWLQNELGMSTQDVCDMIRRSTALLFRDLDVIEARTKYILDGPVGEGLGKILRRGVSTERTESLEEKQEIVLSRVRELVIKYSEVVANDIQPVVEYLQSIGCDTLMLGRIAYRRPQLFQYQIETLMQRVEFFAENLGLDPGNSVSSSQTNVGTGDAASTQKSVVDLMAVMPDVFSQNIPNNLEPKFRYFRNELGLSRAQLRSILVDRPQILALSLENNLVPKIQYLTTPVNKGGAGMPSKGLRQLLVDTPQILRERLTDRIQPRCQVALDRGLILPRDAPEKFLTMSDSIWNAWVQADFKESQLEEAKLVLKRQRKATSVPK